MLIVIPSKSRANRQTTLSCLPVLFRPKVHLCVYANELESYLHHKVSPLIPAREVEGIAQKRQWLLEYAASIGEDKVVMLDDDLVFATRREDDPTKFRMSIDADILRMFEQIEELLGTYAMVGVSGREGANRKIAPLVENTRLMRVLGYRADIFRRENILASTGDVMCDFNAVLEVLTRGYRVVNINWIVQNQHGSNTSGGCSTYRTAGVQESAALALQERFPKFVRLVGKQTKTSWGGEFRTDVVISWKKAYEMGISNARK